jgi:hypothetical protein
MSAAHNNRDNRIQAGEFASVISCWAGGVLGRVACEGKEQRLCQRSGRVEKVLATHWQHPTILLLIELAAWYSEK